MTLPSRPEEFHPEPLTDPDLTLSRHPARAIARRLPPSIEYQVPPVAGWPDLKGDDLLPSLRGHYTRFNTTTEQSAPDRCIGTFGLTGSPLAPFPFTSPTRFSSSVQEPGLESRPLYTGHHMDSNAGILHADPGAVVQPRFWCRLRRFDASSRVRLRSSLQSLPDAINAASFNHDVHDRSFWL